MVKWPNLYRYSHRGHGWINRWLDSSSAGIEFTVVWQGDSDPFDIPPLDVDLLIFGACFDQPWEGHFSAYCTITYDYDVSYTQDVNLRERAQNRVSYRNHIDAEGKQGFNALHAKTRFRTSSHEAKLNYVLLAGGAAVGLGITLIVESLISALVRLERSLRKKTKRRRGLGAVDSSASDQEAGDEAE